MISATLSWLHRKHSYNDGYYLTAYDGLCRVLEIFHDPQRGLPFGRFQFANRGFTIYGFDFTPSGTSRGTLNLIKQGNLNRREQPTN